MEVLSRGASDRGSILSAMLHKLSLSLRHSNHEVNMHRISDAPVTPGVHTWPGSCHCGAVRFEVDVDLSQGTHQCNCTWCTKMGWWSVIVRPQAFRVLQGAELFEPRDPAVLGVRRRCPTCGITTFGEGDIPEIGGAFVGINLRCLDGVDLDGVPVRYLDGLHDTWAPLAMEVWHSPIPRT